MTYENDLMLPADVLYISRYSLSGIVLFKIFATFTELIINDTDGELFKFGVTDAGLNLMNQSVWDAGEGAWAKFSGIKPKWEAHLHEKYMRSLFYNSTGESFLKGMKIPYPRDFNTGATIRPKR